MRLKTRVASELNNPARWNQSLRPWFDTAAYQKRLDDRVGLNRDGLPIVVLRWGQEVRQRVWGEETPRYWLKRSKTPTGVTYWTVARWIFEIRLEPAIWSDAWEKSRYSMVDPTEGNPRCGDCGVSDEPLMLSGKLYCRACAGTNITGGAVVDKGPPPDEYFSFMQECAVHEGAIDPVNHWPQCCARAFYTETKWGGPHARCWGEYRNPNDDDIGLIAKAVAMTQSNPYEPLTPAQLAETELLANKQMDRAAEQFDAMQLEMMKEVQQAWLAQRVYSGAGGPSRKLPDLT